MVLSNETEAERPHPFWYARVLGIFHAQVRDLSRNDSDYQRQEFLWVRWLGREPGQHDGRLVRRLDRVGYEENAAVAYGFLNPAQVVRAAHLIPAFESGYLDKGDYTGPSPSADDGESDWDFFYVNRSVN